MGVDFHANSCFDVQKDKMSAFDYLIEQLQRFGFVYDKMGPSGKETLNAQLSSIERGEDNSVWMINKDGCYIQLAIDFRREIALQWLYLSFPADNIVTDPPETGQTFLEAIVQTLTQFHVFAHAEITWGGLASDWWMGDEAIKQRRLSALYWLQILGPQFVESIGRGKLLHAPAWQIRELADRSVIVRLSKHPHIYEKISGVYLHDYLGLEYIG